VTYLEDQNRYRLSTGTEFAAHGGVLGMDAQGRGISEGWDGGVDETRFTRRERLEIAGYMMRRWFRWALKRTP
jgi:hypothetical protein